MIKGKVKIQDAFKITGRGIAVVCNIVEGTVSKENMLVLGETEYKINGVEMFRKLFDGVDDCFNNIGILINGEDNDNLKSIVNSFKGHTVNIMEAKTEVEVSIPGLEGLYYTISFKNGTGPEFVIWTHEKGNPKRKVKEFLAMPKKLGKAITEYVQDCIDGD